MTSSDDRAALPAELPRIAADFNALVTSRPHRVLLDSYETRRDLEDQRLGLHEGLRALFHQADADERGESDAILCAGTVHHDPERGWFAVLDGDRITWESDWR